jgi:hypothetical protein
MAIQQGGLYDDPLFISGNKINGLVANLGTMDDSTSVQLLGSSGRVAYQAGAFSWLRIYSATQRTLLEGGLDASEGRLEEVRTKALPPRAGMTRQREMRPLRKDSRVRADRRL